MALADDAAETSRIGGQWDHWTRRSQSPVTIDAAAWDKVVDSQLMRAEQAERIGRARIFLIEAIALLDEHASKALRLALDRALEALK